MQKEKLLKDLLKTLLDNRLNKLEKKHNEEMKDIKLIKSYYTKQGELIKSLMPIKKIDPPNSKRLQIKKKTTKGKLSSCRLYTPSQKKIISKSKERDNNNNNNKKNENNKDNFKHLNKTKIDGNYKAKNKSFYVITKKNTIDNANNNNKSNNRKRKYKTPIRKLYHSSLNSMIQYKKDNRHQPKTPSSSFYNDISSSKQDNNIGINRKNKIEILDSFNRPNKSYIIGNSLNKSNMNMSNSNLYINDNNSVNKRSSQRITSSLKKAIKISHVKNNKSNLYLEQFMGKEKLIKNDNKFILNKNFGEWLASEEGRDILILISNYLDIRSKYNLFSCQKKYLKYLYHLIEDLYTEFKENNKINPNSNIIREKINEIKEKYSPNDLNINNIHFNLSRGTLKAFELLNDKEHEKFFNNDKYYLFSDDIYIVYKIIFQLIKNNEVKQSESKKEFYEKMGNFVHRNIDDKNKIGDFFRNMVNEFEFSEENVYQIKKIIKGNEEKLKPKNYSQICATTGLVIFLIKDILEYLGFNYNGNKSCPIFILMNLEFLEKVKTKLPNYLKFLKNILKT